MFLWGKLPGCSFSKLVKRKLGSAPVIPQVHLFELFVIFVLMGGPTAPGFRGFICEKDIFLALSGAALLSLVSQILTGADSHKALLDDPLTSITLTFTGGSKRFRNTFRIKVFLDTLSSSLSKSEFERLCFPRRN